MAKVKGSALYVKIAATILAISLIVFREFIFYGHDFLFDGVLSDLLRANYPVYCSLYDNLTQGWSFWSWNMGIGTSVLTHADVMFDPFTYITFLFGREHIADMMVWSFVMKIICEGVSIAVYLNYLRFNSRAVLIASVLYAFTGYSLIMGSNLALGTILVIFPFILIGVEKLLKEKKIAVLLLSLFLTCMLSYYFFYVSGILVVIYLIARSIYEKKQCSTILIFLMVLAGTAVAVMGMAGGILLPQMDLVRNSSRMEPFDAEKLRDLLLPGFDVLITAILRVFANDILGNMVVDGYYGGLHDYFQVSTYTSALCIILVFQVWNLMTDKQKKMLKWSFILTVVAILFPFFSFILNAFSTVNYRWMFFVNLQVTVTLAFCLDLLFGKGETVRKL
ncbi:MAG: YfhO family protein [Eubacterium sp.]|nr:YfhO family protein [Eubacterium sp.]